MATNKQYGLPDVESTVPMPQYKMLPIGIEPKDVWLSQRYSNLCGAIERYYNANIVIPVEWIEEYNELVERIKIY